MTESTKDYELHKGEIAKWSEVTFNLLVIAVICIFLITGFDAMAGAKLYHLKHAISTLSPIPIGINKWLWIGIAIILLMVSIYPMYQIAKYFKQTSYQKSEWQNIMTSMEHHTFDVEFKLLNQRVTSTTINYINAIFMPNQFFGKAFGALFNITLAQIINGFSITVILNLVYDLICHIADLCKRVAPLIWHGIQWLTYQATNQYTLTSLFVIIMLIPFIFAKRRKPQWAKYSLLGLQLIGLLGTVISLLFS